MKTFIDYILENKMPSIRCGYDWSILNICDLEIGKSNIIDGIIYIPYRNNSSVHLLSVQWDKNGSCIKKEQYPTYYYYDLVLR